MSEKKWDQHFNSVILHEKGAPNRLFSVTFCTMIIALRSNTSACEDFFTFTLALHAYEKCAMNENVC